MRKWLVVGAVVCVAFATMATQCQPQEVWGASIQTVTDFSSHSDVNAAASIDPSMGGPNAPEVCEGVVSQVTGRRDYCRVVHGMEAFADYRDWLVTITLNGGTPQLPGPVSAYDPYYGWTITTPEGTTFENCQRAQLSSPYPGLVMNCDFMVTNEFFSTDAPGGGLQFSYLLDKLWHWNKYELNPDINCAGAIASLWAGVIGAYISYRLLSDCSDMPYGS